MIRLGISMTVAALFIACGPESRSALVESTSDESAILSKVGPTDPPPAVDAWSLNFPTNPDSSPAEGTIGDVVVMNGCRFSAIIHQVTFQRFVGIMVSPVSLKSCTITKALGGNGYAHLGTYNGPNAYARLAGYPALGKLAFGSSGSGGPFGIASLTMSTLSVKLVNASNSAVLRSTVQGVCASSSGGQILPTTTLYADPTSGSFYIGGTKNAPTGLAGDAACPGFPGPISTYTLEYTNFATTSGPVATPVFTP